MANQPCRSVNPVAWERSCEQHCTATRSQRHFSMLSLMHRKASLLTRERSEDRLSWLNQVGQLKCCCRGRDETSSHKDSLKILVHIDLKAVEPWLVSPVERWSPKDPLLSEIGTLWSWRRNYGQLRYLWRLLCLNSAQFKLRRTKFARKWSSTLLHHHQKAELFHTRNNGALLSCCLHQIVTLQSQCCSCNWDSSDPATFVFNFPVCCWLILVSLCCQI